MKEPANFDPALELHHMLQANYDEDYRDVVDELNTMYSRLSVDEKLRHPKFSVHLHSREDVPAALQQTLYLLALICDITDHLGWLVEKKRFPSQPKLAAILGQLASIIRADIDNLPRTASEATERMKIEAQVIEDEALRVVG